MTAAERINREHAERVRAVQRRHAYDRVMHRIAELEGRRRLSELAGRPRCAFDAEEIEHLRMQGDAMYSEMVAAGQVPERGPR